MWVWVYGDPARKAEREGKAYLFKDERNCRASRKRKKKTISWRGDVPEKVREGEGNSERRGKWSWEEEGHHHLGEEEGTGTKGGPFCRPGVGTLCARFAIGYSPIYLIKWRRSKIERIKRKKEFQMSFRLTITGTNFLKNLTPCCSM